MSGLNTTAGASTAQSIWAAAKPWVITFGIVLAMVATIMILFQDRGASFYIQDFTVPAAP